jgi:amino acid adenylation domain-containing protein
MFVNWFVESCRKFAERPAVEVHGVRMSYKSLALSAGKIAEALHKQHLEKSPIGLLAYRSFVSYAGVLGIMYSKNAYLPLNPNFPVKRTEKMIDMVKCKVLIVGNECNAYFRELLPTLREPMTVILPDSEGLGDLSSDPKDDFIFSSQMEDSVEFSDIKDIDEDAISCLVFTSGSTGEPKIVQQSNRNVSTYLDHVSKRYRLDEHDRVSQAFEPTFDNSIHDMFICWKYGACLYCVPRNQLMMPSGFIKDKKLTVWYSVPSIGVNMLRLNRLKENAFPDLRYTLFCGEALPKNLAEHWAKAARNSKIENYYGITETTHQVSVYEWDSEKSEEECINDIVSIGKTFEGIDYCILDENRNDVKPGQAGELYLSGIQVTRGYYNDPERTAESFVRIPNRANQIWFKTGDLVKERENSNLNYLGRLDNQVQILGNRVELQEVDCILKRAADTELVVSVAWPVEDGMAKSIVCFIAESAEKEKEKILKHCRNSLPPYMVPKDIFFVDKLPLNDNGKFDRKKLVAMLEQRT